MAKIVLNPVLNLQNETSAVATINVNSDRIEAAIENTLSRDGTSPNEMNADLDMNNHRIYNLPKATTATEPVRKQEFDNLILDVQAQVGPAYLTSYDNTISGLAATNVQDAIDEVEGRVQALEVSDGNQDTAIDNLDIRVTALESGGSTGLITLDETYGADPTGVVNSSAAWVAASTAGGTTYVRKGTYLISSTAILAGSCTFVCEQGVQINSTHDEATFRLDTSGITFKGNISSITGPRSTTEYLQDNTAFRLNGTSGAPIYNTSISGFLITEFKESGLWATYAHDVDFSMNVVTDVTYAASMWLSCNNTKYRLNTIRDIKPGSGGVSPKLGAYGTAFSRSSGSDSVCSGFLVEENDIDGVVTWTGIDTHGGSDGRIVNNKIFNCHIGIGITIEGTTSPLNIVVYGNEIKGHPQGGVSINGGTIHSGTAINVSGYASGVGARNIKVFGNLIRESGWFDGANYTPAMSFQSTEGCSAVNNSFSFCRDLGIGVFYQNIGLTLTGNTFQELAPDGQTYGLGVWVSSDTNIVRLGNNSVVNGSVTSLYLYRVENQTSGYMVLVSRDNYAFNATNKWYSGSSSATGIVDMGASI